MEMISTILSNSEIIINIFVLVVAILMFAVSFVKSWVNSKAYQCAQQAIDFANQVGGENNGTKLVRAVSFAETLILSKVPLAFRHFVDKLIDAEKIANIIERRLTEQKHNELNEKK